MKARYQFLDVYRGIVVLLMIQGHVVREFLLEPLQNTASFRLHELFHGITGPGFLFGAGITFGITAQTRWNDYLSFSPSLWKRVKKIVLLLGIAYALHLPFLSLSKTLTHATAEQWNDLWNFDVLQCIGFGILILQLTVISMRKERWFVFSLATLMVVALYSAPWVWREGGSIPQFLSNALTGSTGSTYPLIPNAAFLFAGALVSYEFLRSVKLGKEAQFVKRLAIAAVGLHVLGFALDKLPFQTYAPYDYWSTSPNFFLIKLGGICLVLCGAWYVSRSAVLGQDQFVIRGLIILGVESLFVYVVHLVVLYGSVVNSNVNLTSLWFQSMGWGYAMGTAAALVGLMWLAARLWNYIRNSHPVLATGLNWWMGTVLVLEFVIRPF